MTASAAPAPAPAPSPTPAPAPAPSPTPAPAPAPAQQSFDFKTAGLNEANLNVVGAKGFKTIDDVVAWGVNSEKFVGAPANELIRLPKDLGDKAAMDPIWQKLGAGKDVADYTKVMSVPKGADGKPGDDSFAKVAAGWFKENSVPLPVAKALTEKWNAQAAEAAQAGANIRSTKFTNDSNTLKTEWGQNYASNEALAQRGAQAVGMTGEMIDALEATMGHAAVMRWAHEIGLKVAGNGDFHVGDLPATFDALSAGAARQKIADLKADREWGARYAKGGKAEKDEMGRLHDIAFGTQHR